MGMHVGGENQKKGKASPEMNVTPLVDVVLVLLIIFMVITPMLDAHFWVHVPNKPKDTPEQPLEELSEDQRPIVVTVNAEGHIQINRDVYSDAEFPQRLKRMLVARGERKIFFDANDNQSYARAVHVMDMARGGGAAHIALVTEAL